MLRAAQMANGESAHLGMREHDASEMHRQPLDAVVLQLRTMLPDESVSRALAETLEPPDAAHVQRAFASLHADGFVSTADDSGELTSMGTFVAQLGLDLQACRRCPRSLSRCSSRGLFRSYAHPSRSFALRARGCSRGAGEHY